MILRKDDIVNAKLTYDDGGKNVTFNVVVRYVDDKECFLAIQDVASYVRPHNNIACNLCLYTDDGYYIIDSKLKNISFSLTEVVWELSFLNKENWRFVERRKGKRKDICLPVKIIYDEMQAYTTEIVRLSESGFLCKLHEEIHQSLKQLTCDVIIDLSEYTDLNIDNNELQLKAKLTRLYTNEKDRMASFKFILIFPMQINTIRTLLKKV